MYSETVRKLTLYVREIQEMGLYRIMADPKMFASFSGTALYFIMLPMIAIMLTIDAVINGIQLIQARNKNIDKWLQFIFSSLSAIASSVSLYGAVIATALGVTFAAGPWFFLSGIALGFTNQLFMMGLNIYRTLESPTNSIQRMHHLQAALNNAYVSLLLAVILGVITFVLLTPVLPLAGTVFAFAAAGLIAMGFLWRLCPHAWKIEIKNTLYLGKPDIEKQYLFDTIEQTHSADTDATKAEHFPGLFTQPDYSEKIRAMPLNKAVHHIHCIITKKIKSLEESPDSKSEKNQQKRSLLVDLQGSLTYPMTIDKQQELLKTRMPNSSGLSAGSSALASPINSADNLQDEESGFILSPANVAKKYPLAFQSFWAEKGEVEQITDAVVELDRAMRERKTSQCMSMY